MDVSARFKVEQSIGCVGAIKAIDRHSQGWQGFSGEASVKQPLSSLPLSRRRPVAVGIVLGPRKEKRTAKVRASVIAH